MFTRLNKVLVAILLLTFVFVPHIGQTNSNVDNIQKICASIKDTINNMSPSVMIGAFIAIVLLMIMFKSLVILTIIVGVLFIAFDNPGEIIDCVKEKFSLIVQDIGLKENMVSILEDDKGKIKEKIVKEKVLQETKNNKT